MSTSTVAAKAESLAAFKKLSFAEQKDHLVSVAQRALSLWNYPQDSKLTLLNITENATFAVEHPEREKIVMRVHRLDYAERNSIRTELAWIDSLKRGGGLDLVSPVKAIDGSYVQTIATPELGEERNVVCFSFVGGEAPRDSHDDNEDIGTMSSILAKIPKWLTVPLFRFAAWAYDAIGRRKGGKSELNEGDVKMYRRLGRIAGRIHTQSKAWRPPEFYKRIEWNWAATFGDGWNNYYGMHYWDLKGSYLSAKDVRTIDACVKLMRTRVEAYGKSPERYGMIHSDLRMSNLLVEGDRFTVLDFDDCGKGWYMYDLACVVGFMEHRPDLKAIVDLIVEGYRETALATEEDLREIPTFVMMRRIGLLQAIMYHLNNTHSGSGESAELSPEILAFYAKGTAVLARRYLTEFKGAPLSTGGHGGGTDSTPGSAAGAEAGIERGKDSAKQATGVYA